MKTSCRDKRKNISMQWTKSKLCPFPLYYIDTGNLSLEVWFDRTLNYWKWCLFSNGEVVKAGQAGNANDAMNLAKMEWMV